MNFVLYNLDSSDQKAVLGCTVDFQKAFNRQDHSILITKLSDLGLPGWLLRIVVAFLEERRIVVHFKGEISNEMSVPGGGPQGTIIALLLFLVLINDFGFDDQNISIGSLITQKKQDLFKELHLKYVDDFSLLESISLKKQLREVPNQTDLALLPGDSRLYSQLEKTKMKAEQNGMKINYKKTQLISFNPCTSINFSPSFIMGGQVLTVVDEIKLLGVTISSDLTWKANTRNMVLKGYRRLWILKRLKNLGAGDVELVDIYVKQIRSVLEYAVPVWQGALSLSEKRDLERVQKSACRIILKNKYLSYTLALKALDLENLESRRNQLCLKFALKTEKHHKFQSWFSPNVKVVNTRSKPDKYARVWANCARFEKSPISFLTGLLNKHYKQK